MKLRALVLSSLLVAGCGGDPVDDQPDGGIDVPDTCPSIFAQDVLAEYHVDISPTEWAALEDEFAHRMEREAAGLDPNPYHPIGLRYVAGGETIEVPQVLIRLKGQSSWHQTIALDPDPKMQFVIAFNEVDPRGRFRGVRKVELDMPRTDHTFLRQRAGLYGLRAAGVPAQCANSARLVINGEYYGLYTHLERLDKEFLQRTFGKDDADGDLWKSGRIIKTNEETFSWARLNRLWNEVHTADELAEIVDLEASIRVWAAEAMIGDADGYHNGRPNFYLYDHPTRGFLWLPHDVDTAFDADFLPPDASPVLPFCENRWARDWIHYLMVVNDLDWVERYIDALAEARATFDVARLQTRIGQWAAQIADSVAADPRRPFSVDAHTTAVSLMRDYVRHRADFVDAFLSCRVNGGEDADGDGFDFCNDCDDADPTIVPGGPELCNGRDDNCDGRIDEGGVCD